MAEITAKRSDNAAIIINRTRVVVIHVAHVSLHANIHQAILSAA
jgi:hypothetical protein